MARKAPKEVLRPRVPVSTTEASASNDETRVTVIGQNKHHEKRLISELIVQYGWNLCEDGNLYKGRDAA